MPIVLDTIGIVCDTVVMEDTDMTEKTVNVPFTVSLEDDGNTVKAYAFDVPDATVTYGSNGTALTKMRDIVIRKVKEAVKHTGREYTRRRIVACVDGTILVVGHDGYAIAGPDRTYATGCYGEPGFDKALEYARKHAASGFGGIAWECSL